MRKALFLSLSAGMVKAFEVNLVIQPNLVLLTPRPVERVERVNRVYPERVVFEPGHDCDRQEEVAMPTRIVPYYPTQESIIATRKRAHRRFRPREEFIVIRK
ncbi:MAG TPA: hypothetical protein V6C82_08125 [Chroococcales cyanobacterium]